MGNLKFKNFKIQNLIFLYFCILAQFTSNAQINKESLPVFVLQGTVKLKGKPVDGVSIELTKNKKQITKIITRKNGMYLFQMDKSNTDKETEYLLNIIKEGTVTGTLRINTYTSKEEIDYVPYVFNLEINLNLPTGTDVNEKHNFGKIKWDAEQGIFDFDKEYAKTIEKANDVLKTDSSKTLVKGTDKIKNVVAGVVVNKGKKADTKTKQKADSSAIQHVALKESLNPASALKEKKGDDKLSQKKTGLVSSKSQVTEKGVVQTTTKPQTSIGKTESELLKKKTDEMAKLKTNKMVTDKKGLAVSGSEKSASSLHSDMKQATNNLASSGTSAPIHTGSVDNKQPARTTDALQSGTKSTNFSSAEIGPNSFDGTTVFSINNEKSKLINAKGKMERKKAENLEKKYETNNILTSLLDVVVEFDKK